MISLVIPSIREKQALEFLTAWQDQLIEADVNTYLVEDNPDKTFNIYEEDYYKLNHLVWRDAPLDMLKSINVKSPGCRQIGFWKAYKDNCEIIITLDDDVRPINGLNLFNSFYDILTKGIPAWVDPLLNYRSRGYPEKNVGSLPVCFHVGSFLSIPDVDGATQLQYEKDFIKSPPQYLPRPTIVPYGQMIPVNGGICGWRREMTPYIHYSLWNERLAYRRFDDIWMGIILKKFLDLNGLRMSYGPPFVNHIRASDSKMNTRYEAEGKKWNEKFWLEFNIQVSNVNIDCTASWNVIFHELGECLKRINNEWAQSEGEAMLKWNSFFKSNIIETSES